MDGSIEITFTDDTSTKMTAVGFRVNEVYDEVNDVYICTYFSDLSFVSSG